MSTAAKQQGGPRKVRWTVPAVDTSVIAWLDAQENISQSVRLLIREAIQRDGYIDVVYKPVEQLPRRDRSQDAGPVDARPVGDPVPDRPEQHEEPASAPAGVSKEPAPPVQVSVDEIMASTRR
ncbi:hypothetical protein C8K30_1011055 [Promicromonospora sp. AC04]|uniref:hypothetical protein n=1 Tax=Promicromonospora sp. AC04 TaxID=2135723 RepID=UPI000D3B4746|nr:hypothetical protein [Promicromonospora sp. AC04]PUB32529.1 hypothetical protein C8K30_1011055 [Promicromonospora sp. AC04]